MDRLIIITRPDLPRPRFVDSEIYENGESLFIENFAAPTFLFCLTNTHVKLKRIVPRRSRFGTVRSIELIWDVIHIRRERGDTASDCRTYGEWKRVRVVEGKGLVLTL